MSDIAAQRRAKADYMREWRKRRNAAGLRVDYHRKDTEYTRGRNLSRYGLTIEWYGRLLAEQGFCCAVCKRHASERLHVDHDHKTGLVRGLLCRKCNVFLGMVGDAPARIRAMIAYIRRA